MGMKKLVGLTILVGVCQSENGSVLQFQNNKDFSSSQRSEHAEVAFRQRKGAL